MITGLRLPRHPQRGLAFAGAFGYLIQALPAPGHWPFMVARCPGPAQRPGRNGGVTEYIGR